MRHKYDAFFQFALKDQRLVFIRDVKNGLKCDCRCPQCGEPLIAYNNLANKNIAHFQHQSLKECHGVYETVIHFLAKEVIKEQGYLLVPDIDYNLSGYASGYEFEPFIRETVNSKIVYFDSIEVEKSNGHFRPDLKCTINEKVIYIEIAVTHFVDETKEKKIYMEGKPVLEIDLSSHDRITTKTQLKHILHSSIADMRWINNRKIGERLMKAEKDAKEITEFINKNKKILKVYGKKRSVYCPRFKLDVDMVNADDVCKRTCYCFVQELESYPSIGDEPYVITNFVECIGHVSSQYFQVLKSKGITADEKISI